MKRRKAPAIIVLCVLLLFVIMPFQSLAATNGDETVYRTRTGECYHRGSCSYLRQSKFAISLRDAVEVYGLRACSKCKPPKYTSDNNSNNSSSRNATAAISGASTSKSSGTPWVLAGIGGIAAGVFVSSRISKGKEKKRKEQERQEYEANKSQFILKLGGKSIREAAGVPNNIKFIDGLPRDNNNRQYGSYTVYLSTNGTCYHEKPGCCSAHRVAHAFLVINRYRPCSKCCRGSVIIPQWYTKYKELEKQCKKYDLDPESPQ